MRPARYVAWLAWRRLTRRGSGALLTVLGLTVAADRATAQAVERIPAAGRSVRAVWFGIPAGQNEGVARLDTDVREALGAPELQVADGEGAVARGQGNREHWLLSLDAVRQSRAAALR